MNHQLSERMLDSAYAVALLLRDLQRFLLRPVSIGAHALIVRDQQVLLIRHRAGSPRWTLPGGGVQRGETLAEAACREAQEEAGCIVRVEQLLGMYYNLPALHSNHNAVFICTLLSEPQPPRANLEISTLRFFDIQQPIPDIDASTARRIAEYRRGNTGLYHEW